jgi:glycosyltransferase involved in cell wall biosynthesis
MAHGAEDMKRKILIIASTMGGGGAERAILNILNHLDREVYEPHLALFQKKGVFLDQLLPDVSVYELQPEATDFLRHNWARIRSLRRLCRQIQPDLAMSVLWQVNIVALLTDAVVGLGCPLIVNEQVSLRQALASEWQRYLFWPLAYLFYRRAARIVAISQGIAAELQEALHLPPTKFTVIHNPLVMPNLPQREADWVKERPLQIVAVGRLVPQKNFPLLLRAVARVGKIRQVQLTILGEGEQRPFLETLVDELGLTFSVTFPGFQPDPFVHVSRADIFVLSSDFEGFANVVVEAMAVGTPVIATDCPYGPAEILQNDRYGLLVPPGDETALANTILALLEDESERLRYGRLGRERAAAYTVERIVPQYEGLFQQVIEQKRHYG